MALSSDQGGCCFSSFVICSGCAWPIPPLLLVEGRLTDFVGGSLAEPGHARSEEPGEAEQRRQVLDHAKHMPGLRFRAQIWMLRVAKAWPRPCALAVHVSCALNLAFSFRPLGLNDGEEDPDSLDACGEYALAEPGNPRCEEPYEDGADLVDNGVAEAST